MANKISAKLSKEQKQRLESLLFEDESIGVFAIIDAAKESSIPVYLAGLQAEYTCLLKGNDAVKLAGVAPYLVKLDPSSDTARWFMDKLYGNNVGFTFKSNKSLQELTLFWSKKVREKVPGTEEKGFFRFYDPRVLREYLVLLEEEGELEAFMGATGSLFIESDQPVQLIVYSKAPDKSKKIKMNRLELNEPHQDTATENKVA